jgi:hypothetical protein
MISTENSRIIVEAELEAALNWSRRYDLGFEWCAHDLRLLLTLTQPETHARYHLRGTFTDYRALPPEWSFTNPEWTSVGLPMDFPNPIQTPFGASIFIRHNLSAVICAPFNRLAYTNHAGPHGDWGGPSNWLEAGPAQVHAETIGDMLQAIYRDFLHTRDRMANS